MADVSKPNNRWRELDSTYFLHPFSVHKELKKEGGHIFVRAEDEYIYTDTGQKILDGMSGLWCCNLGYNVPEVKQAIASQLEELPYYNSFFQCTHPPALELAERLISIAPDNMKEVFYTNSGSEANDTNLRMIWRYWHVKGEPNRKTIISRKMGYHGSTIAGATLSGFGNMHNQITHISNVEQINAPYQFENGVGLSEEEYGLRASAELEEKILEIGAENVAAFIGEPIMGAGGVIVPPSNYWAEVRSICDRYDILLVMDEVICGFGRMGTWFGAQYYGIEPDLMTFAKAITNGFQPLGGVMVSEKVADVLNRDDDEFSHGFTYSGHPTSCAAALATLDILENRNIIGRVKDEIGPYFQQRMQELSDHEIVGEIRTLGLFCAIELVANKSTNERFDSEQKASVTCRNASIDAGLMMRGVGDNIMVIAPPLVINRSQVDEIFDKALIALNKTRDTISTP